MRKAVLIGLTVGLSLAATAIGAHEILSHKANEKRAELGLYKTLEVVLANTGNIEQLIQEDQHQKTSVAWLLYMAKFSADTGKPMPTPQARQTYLKAISKVHQMELLILLDSLHERTREISEARAKELASVGVTPQERITLPESVEQSLQKCRTTMDERYRSNLLMGYWSYLRYEYDVAFDKRIESCTELQAHAKHAFQESA